MRMVQCRNVVGAGARGVALVIGFSAATQAAMAQPPAPTQQAPAQQQSIPDAPRPQTLPDLRTITPVGPAVPVPETPLPAASQALPASPRPQNTEPDPEIPPPGQGPGAIMKAVQVNLVEVPFTVKDSKGQLVPGLMPRDIRVYENGLRQHMSFFTSDPFPLSVSLVIDQSVTTDVMGKINTALGALQGAFTPYDEVAVFTYNNGVKEQTAFTAAQSQRLGVILERSKGKGRETAAILGGPLGATNNVNGKNVDPNTAPNRSNPGAGFNKVEKEFHTLNDAILAAARETTKAGRGRRRIVYVISDGKEYGSAAREKDVIKYCQQNKVAVYATLVGDSAIPGLGFLDRIHLPLTMRDDVLPRYAGATGGQVDPEFRTRGIEKSFAKITEEVRTQYTVAYYSHEPILDGKYRKLEVTVLRPNLTVISKEGYYPSVQDSRPAPVTPTATP